MNYNPPNEPIQRRIRLPLSYAGLTERAVIHWEDGHTEALTLARDYSVEVRQMSPPAVAFGLR